ncbi:MAG: fused response regulator/phosphatase [Candidatus Omnitrophota bacterium]
MKNESSSNKQRDILIVDDERINLDLLSAILRLEGYGVRCAESGEEALDAVESNLPDLVIMDVCMPGISGFEACQKIKSFSNDNYVPVMLLTALSETSRKVEGLDAGADDYLVKPPQKMELLARVRSLLRIRDLQHRLLEANKKLEESNLQLSAAQKTIEKDIALIADIQRSFLPARFPLHPEIEFGKYYEPCALAGGDYFDVIEAGRGKWGILMADVTGHGAPAAVVMAITHTIVHSFLGAFHYPSTVLKATNEKLNAHLAPTFFVTMFYGVLDLEKMIFRYSSAGHEPMMLFRARERKVELLKTEHGYPLKLMESDDYDEKVIRLEPEDKIVLFTDGLVEFRNERKELFSPERLEGLILKYHHLPPQPFVDAIIAEVKSFNSSATFKDDVSLLVIEGKRPLERFP